MKSLPGIIDYDGIEIKREFQRKDREFTYSLKIPFEHIFDLNVSIANRKLVNLSSGLVRHLYDESGVICYPDGVKIIENQLITDSSKKRIYHWDYDKHLQALEIKDKNLNVLCPAYLNGWRDLGQNPWHVFWENNTNGERFLKDDGTISNNPDSIDRLVRIKEDDIYGITRNNNLDSGRVYTSFIVPNKGKPYIDEVRFDENQDIYSNDMNQNLSSVINWAASGKPLVKNGNPVNIEDVVEQYYDVAHVFAVSNEKIENKESRPDRLRKGDLVQKLYKNYPKDFKKNCIDVMSDGYEKGKYYFDVVGVDDSKFMILQKYGTLDDVSKSAQEIGMKDAIIVDEGGSVATWSWYHGPNGGFENCSSYLRPQAIAVLGIKLNYPL
jgi:hypothetical protein